MRKMNNKGFTLIELLAVIVILAVIMVVTIPTVLSSMNGAKQNQFNNAAKSVGTWLNSQYELHTLGVSVTGDQSINPAFSTWIATAKTDGTPNQLNTDNILIAAGISGGTANATGTATYNSTYGKWCVTLSATANGQFAGSSDASSC